MFRQVAEIRTKTDTEGIPRNGTNLGEKDKASGRTFDGELRWARTRESRPPINFLQPKQHLIGLLKK
jgi:hypothetical protein